MRTRSHMIAMLAAAAMAGPSFLGAQRLDAASIAAAASIDTVSPSSGKPGKHRNSGRGSPRRNWHTSWKGAPNHQKTAREQRHHAEGRNCFRTDYHAQRMEWLARNQHVIVQREIAQARARRGY